MVLVILRFLILAGLVIGITYFAYRKMRRVARQDSITLPLDEAEDKIGTVLKEAEDAPDVDKKELRQAKKKIGDILEEGESDEGYY